MSNSKVTALVRASDPLTSVLAAEGALEFAGSHCDRIKAALTKHECMTAAEIARATGLTVVQIDRRMPELERVGVASVVQHEGEDLIRDGYRVWERS